MEAKLPNFLLVGTAKSGTTSLYHYLKQHPEVYMSEMKEPRFFASSIFKKLNHNDPRYEIVLKSATFTFEDYIKLFENVRKERAIGEATVIYLYFYKIAIHEIKKYLGDVKIIIILRNPIDRAFSAYTYLLRDKFEALSFEKCLEIEKERIKANWSPTYFLKDLGFYYKQVKAYMENFSQVRIYLYDDLKNCTLGLIKDVYEFLEVDSSFVPDMSIRYNTSSIPRIRVLQRLFFEYKPLKKTLRPLFLNAVGKEKTEKLINYFKDKNSKKISLEPETRRYLVELYRDDILMLQSLIKRDLSDWLK